jgi:hypothetical protein
MGTGNSVGDPATTLVTAFDGGECRHHPTQPLTALSMQQLAKGFTLDPPLQGAALHSDDERVQICNAAPCWSYCTFHAAVGRMMSPL